MNKLPAAWYTSKMTEEEQTVLKSKLMNADEILEILKDKLLMAQKKSYKEMLSRTKNDDETTVRVAKFLKEQQIYETIVDKYLTFK